VFVAAVLMFVLAFYLLPGLALIVWLTRFNFCPLGVCRALMVLPSGIVEGGNVVLAFIATWIGVILARRWAGEAWAGSRVGIWSTALLSRQGMTGFYRLVLISVPVLLIFGWGFGTHDAAAWVLGALVWLAAWQELSGGALGQRAQSILLTFPMQVATQRPRPWRPEGSSPRTASDDVLEVVDNLWVARLRRDEVQIHTNTADSRSAIS